MRQSVACAALAAAVCCSGCLLEGPGAGPVPFEPLLLDLGGQTFSGPGHFTFPAGSQVDGRVYLASRAFGPLDLLDLGVGPGPVSLERLPSAGEFRLTATCPGEAAFEAQVNGVPWPFYGFTLAATDLAHEQLGFSWGGGSKWTFVPDGGRLQLRVGDSASLRATWAGRCGADSTQREAYEALLTFVDQFGLGHDAAGSTASLYSAFAGTDVFTATVGAAHASVSVDFVP